jgi:hypothetical protein
MMLLALLFASVVVAALITALWLTRNTIPNSCYNAHQVQTVWQCKNSSMDGKTQSNATTHSRSPQYSYDTASFPYPTASHRSSHTTDGLKCNSYSGLR